MAITSVPPLEPTSYQDRHTGFLICGAVQIILGIMAAGAAPMVLLSSVLARRVNPGAAMPLRSMIPASLMYLAAAAVLITLGIGSVQVKRWGRALTLVVSWLWLVIGTIGVLATLVLIPRSLRGALSSIPNQPGGPDTTIIMSVVATIMIAFVAILYVVVPLVFVLFYGSRNARETANHRDPVERWTDRCPGPVLAACAMMLLGGVSYAAMVISYPLVPFFGGYVTGIPGIAACLLLAFAWIVLAFRLYSLKPRAWWVAFLAHTLMSVSGMVTFFRLGMGPIYQHLQTPPQQMEMMRRMGFMNTSALGYFGIVSGVLFLAYFLWIKRFFKSAEEPVATPAALT
jgi:uncharacterized membrane protein